MENLKNKALLRLPLINWIAIGGCVALFAYFFYFYSPFMHGRHSLLNWLAFYWNPSSNMDMDHGWLIPPLSAYMAYHALKGLRHESTAGSMHGLWSLLAGGLMFLVAIRTQQARVAAAAVPFLLIGIVWYYWGAKAALKSAFPFFFLYFAIPVPLFQHATVGLQLLSAEMAHWGAGVCGVETVLIGTNISSADGSWDAYNIVGGCSGIRSLMAVLMISTVWAFLADRLAWWKRILLALSAIPLSIIGNSFRVISIFVCAEYINPAFAGKTWHDWSGLLFFFPATLVGLTVLYGILLGEIPFLRKRKVIIRKNNSEQTEGEQV